MNHQRKIKKARLICLIVTVIMVASLLMSNVGMYADSCYYYGSYCYYCYSYSCYDYYNHCYGGNTGGGGSTGGGGGGSTVTDWQVTLTYDANGGVGAPPKQVFWVQAGTYISQIVPTRPGYEFVGWTVSQYTSPPPTGKAGYQPGDFIRRDKDTTVYAMWRATVMTYTLTYDANGGMGAPPAQTVNGAQGIYLSTIIPIRASHTFLGWSTSSTSTTAQYQPGAYVYLDRNMTLYAVWQQTPQTYTLTYDANGGTGAPPPQQAAGGSTVTVSYVTPVRTNHTFLGWHTNRSATAPAYQPGQLETMPYQNITLYAIWQQTAQIYTLTYDANGGTGAPLPQQAAGGSTVTVSTQMPTRTGYTFLGWHTNRNATAPAYQPGQLATMPYQNITLYAVWRLER